MYNYRFIAKTVGILLVILSLFIGATTLVSLEISRNDTNSFLMSGLICLFLGLSLWLTTYRKASTKLEKRDAYLLVLISWVVISIFGSLPYLFYTNFSSIPNAIFESISGFTTTGISTFNNVEALPKGLLFWRAQTQWIGGMGSILFAFIVLPFLNIGGMELFATDGHGISFLKLSPKLNQTAFRLILIYCLLTIAATLLLWLAGMEFFDAVCHAMSTVSTGGFSTKNNNIAHFNNPTIDLVLMVFMFLSGINYSLIYMTIVFNFKPILKNEELFYFLGFVLFLSILLFSILLATSVDVFHSLRYSVFTTLSILTTTGFLNSETTIWPSYALNFFFLMLFLGSSTGSTTGGIKIFRLVAIVKNIYYEMKRSLHPRAVIPLRINKKNISEEIVGEVILFVLLYLLLFAIGSIVLVFDGIDFETAIGASLTALSNVGPSVGRVINPAGYASFPVFSKWMLSVLMLAGRLEIFTLFIVFTPQFRRV
ncbi:MAG TPA: TrkH family potassium uptake protein [Salinivirgaceae bacterium]|nr:TrkH family potassium uptake protein [Salinivirgaceae bacterium]